MATYHAADANQSDPLFPAGSPLSVPHPDETLSGGGEMGARIRAFDWSATPLGPADAWPQSLRTAVSICLASRFPMLIWWGPDLIMLYNDAYRPILGQSKHPGALGQAGRACWPEIWDTIGPMLTGVLEHGEATWSDNQLLLLDRNGYVEECYFTFSYSPIRDESGGVGGVFTAVTETTGAVLGARRLRTLREVASATAETRTAEDACRQAAEALTGSPEDLPFALVYLLEPDGMRATLCGATGVRAGSPAAPATIALDGSTQPEGDPWALAQVMRTGQPHLAQRLGARMGGAERFAESFTAALAPDAALVLPVARPGQERAEAFLVAGVSPRRALDGTYRAFFDLVAGQIATAIANARAHQEERARAELLAALDRAKTDFFSNVSHEFRTPLTLLLGPLADALGDGEQPLDPRTRQQLDMAHRNALRLLKLVNTLLDFSRIEAGRADAVYEAVDLASITRDLASAFRSAIERAGLRFVVDCPPLPETLEPVYVDRDMWEKIVLNLLSNAFKFTFTGEIEITLHPVQISPPHEEGKQKHGKRARRAARTAVELRVRDTGVGIAPDELPHLFERFYRMRGTRARTHEGSGIGLALVRELVRLHGGTLRVESAPEQGTCFTVTLPTGRAHLPAARLDTGPRLAPTTLGAAPFVEEALRWLPNGEPPIALGTRDKPVGAPEAPIATADRAAPLPSAATGIEVRESRARILIVDDNADMRDYLARLLGERWRVEVAAGGASALAVARAHPPDLVLCDIMLPDMDGLAVLRALRDDPQTRALPIILLSARAGEEAAAEGLRAGADDYLVKPFAARDLLVRVGSHLGLAQMRQEAARREHEHAEHLRKLATASLDISATLVLDERAQRIAWHARDVVSARQAVVWVAINGSDDPLIAASHVEEEAPAVACALGALPQVAARHERLKRPLRLVGHEVAGDSATGTLAALLGGAGQGWLSAPLIAREGQAIGLVMATGKAGSPATDFSAEDEHTLVQLAQLAASALENAALFEEIHTANAMRDAALFMVTHDLKQPLTAVKANVQMLQRQARRADQLESAHVRERLATIDQTADKMTDQINELLDLARLQAGQPLELEREPVDLVAFVEQLVKEQRQTAARHTIRIDAQNVALEGVWDAPRLARVLGNLLSNAVKYSPQGGEIVLRLGREEPRAGETSGPWAVVSVTDQGMGIPAADLPHIFEPFRRASNVAKSAIPGTGIGLASAHNVVRQHGGTLTVQSQLGVGTTFTLRLPLPPAADAQMDAPADIADI